MHSKKANGFFVTGTDTDAGKTTVTTHLMHELKMKGFTSIGCKPIACGLNEDFNNEDVLKYEAINFLPLTRKQINPFCFELPVSPNIAAKAAGIEICITRLATELQTLRSLPVNYIFFEGIGGWKVPLNDQHTTADLARDLKLPIIFVVGIRVGCINHSLLTFESMLRENIPIAGWVANIIEPATPVIDEHISTLKRWILAPFLGTLLFQNKSNHCFNLDLLIA